MLVIEYDAIEVDHCLTCLGTWLDHGELDLIAERAKGDASAILAALSKAQVRRSDRRKCPRCRRHMKSVTLSSPAGLEIDVCPDSHGYWFDHGELVTLVRSQGGGSNAVADYFAQVFRSELESGPKDSKGE